MRKVAAETKLQLISLRNIKSKAADYKFEQQRRAKLKTSKKNFLNNSEKVKQTKSQYSEYLSKERAQNTNKRLNKH